MSVNGFMKILVRALEVRDHRDPIERQAVYEMSRQTLERFFLQSTALDEESRAAQRDELEAAIAEIERRFQSVDEERGGAETDPTVTEEAIAPPASPPLDVRPPSPEATAPVEPDDAPAAPATPDREAAIDAPAASDPADRPERHHFPPTDDLFVVRPDDEPPSPFEVAVEADEAEAMRRNRRGMQVLLVLLLLIVVATATGLDEAIRRLLVGHSLPGSSIETVGPGLSSPTGWTIGDEIARLPRLPEANTTSARLVIDGGAPIDAVGRIAWTRQGSKDQPELNGRVTFPGRSTVIELQFEDEASGGDGFDRMIVASFVDLPETLTDIAMFNRVDPKGLVERTAEGTVVRIGLDRALYGYRGVPADRAAAFEERSLIRLRFTFESGRRGQVLLRLPDPG